MNVQFTTSNGGAWQAPGEESPTTLIEVTLSRRNLLALLSKVDDPDSARIITRQCDGAFLIVRAEPDSEHYQDRVPGRMFAKSEEFIVNSEADLIGVV